MNLSQKIMPKSDYIYYDRHTNRIQFRYILL
nr:MAG TPA: hypothetical protein [Caudoviricetes sp.]